MTRFGDDGREMPHGPAFDDGDIDAILAGTSGEDLASVGSFVDDVRRAAGAVPIPSAALAAALASGISPTETAPMPKWRKLTMKIKGFVAGLSVAGKLALGAGVAAAATTGAGAAGILPGPVQHAFASAVHAVTPFDAPGGDHGGNEAGPPPGDTTTTIGDSTPTTVLADPGDHSGDGGGVTATTIAGNDGSADAGATTPTTAREADGDHHDGSGDGSDTPTTIATTPTTGHHDGGGDGDSNNPESLSIHCERVEHSAAVSCDWSASDSPAHDHYVLLRIGDGSGRVPYVGNDLSHTDDTVSHDATFNYGYRVDSIDAHGNVVAHSPMVYVECCTN